MATVGELEGERNLVGVRVLMPVKPDDKGGITDAVLHDLLHDQFAAMPEPVMRIRHVWPMEGERVGAFFYRPGDSRMYAVTGMPREQFLALEVVDA